MFGITAQLGYEFTASVGNIASGIALACKLVAIETDCCIRETAAYYFKGKCHISFVRGAVFIINILSVNMRYRYLIGVTCHNAGFVHTADILTQSAVPVIHHICAASVFIKYGRKNGIVIFCKNNGAVYIHALIEINGVCNLVVHHTVCFYSKQCLRF